MIAFDLVNMAALTPMPLYKFRLNVVIEDRCDREKNGVDVLVQ